MGKFLKTSKVVIILSGRYAGKKAVIVQSYDQGTAEHSYGCALVAGIERYPLKVTRKMSKKKIAARSRIKPFVKVVNYNHLMPTRYTMDMSEALKTAVPTTVVKDPTARKQSKQDLKKILQERYTQGKNTWFFTKLRF